MTQNLVRKQNTSIEPALSFDDMLAQADTLLKSQFLPKEITSKEQALVVMITGRELGMGIMQAFRSIYVVGGKPAMLPHAMRALVEHSGVCEKFQVLEASAKQCRIVVQRKGRDEREIVFTWEMAERMKAFEYVNNVRKTISLSEKPAYKTMPETMLEWRATSKACRTEFPDIVLGIYTVEELEAEIDIQKNPGEDAKIVEVRQPEKEPSIVDTSDIPDEQLGNYVIPGSRNSQAKRLSEIAGETTETGRAKGIEYLEDLQEKHPDARVRSIIKRFTDLVLNQPEEE